MYITIGYVHNNLILNECIYISLECKIQHIIMQVIAVFAIAI